MGSVRKDRTGRVGPALLQHHAPRWPQGLLSRGGHWDGGSEQIHVCQDTQNPISSPWWMFRRLLPSVLHPSLLPALTELETPSPLRNKPPALLCWALGRGTGSPLILDGWKGFLGVSNAGSEPQHCYVENQGTVVRSATATAQIQTSCPLPCKVDLFTPNRHLSKTQTMPSLGYSGVPRMEVVLPLRKPSVCC